MAVEVLVTGGDTELGRAVAEGFRDAGHTITLAGARRDDLEVAAKELEADAIVCDNTDPASLFYPADGHMNAAGHALVAEATLHTLLGSDPIKPPATCARLVNMTATAYVTR